MVDPPHTCTQALCSQSALGVPCPSWSPALEEEYSRVQPKSDDTGSPGCPMGSVGLQGLRETTEREPSGQAGGAMEDVLPEILGDRLTGKELRHLDSGEPHQSTQGNLSELVLFIEIKSGEHKVRRSSVSHLSCLALSDLMGCQAPLSMEYF